MEEYGKITDQTLEPDERDKGNVTKEKKTNQGFNIWAALFGFFYYIYKGLWKKGLLLIGLTMIILTIVHLVFPRLSLSTLSSPVSIGLFGTMANIDLYRKEQYGETMWRELPAVFQRNWFVIGLYAFTLIISLIIPATPLSEIEETSTEVVTELLVDYYEIPLEAVDVRILEEIEGEEHIYLADATLSDDSVLKVIIEYFPDSHYIEVFIPEEEILYLFGDLNL